MLDWIALHRSSFAHGDHGTDLNVLASPFQGFRQVFDAMPKDDVAGWQAVASRLEGLPDALLRYRASLEAGLAEGSGVAARQVRGVIGQGRFHTGEGSYFRDLPRVFAAERIDDPALARRLEASVDQALAGWGAFTDWLEQHYLPSAPTRDGVGRDRYVRAMRRFLGSEPDPDETMAWGWSEVERVQAEWREVAEQIAPGRSRAEVLAAVREATAISDRAAFLTEMSRRQAQALAQLEAHFDVPEVIRRIDVRAAPRGGPPGAYYTPPSEDLVRPGTIWYSFGEGGPFPMFDQVAAAYHEGFPGHHLQCGIAALQQADLCRVQRVLVRYSGSAEGWALYAERLMSELGYYDRPEYELGRLTSELLRACRVVFDIGAHLDLPIPQTASFHPGERWSFELGVELLCEVAGQTVPFAESEVARYLGWPGQAISYKVGERAILALRDAWLQSGRGLREFHSELLRCGNVGLDVLREQLTAQ
jgi:uncharacterized protein (DUF885 family)